MYSILFKSITFFHRKIRGHSPKCNVLKKAVFGAWPSEGHVVGWNWLVKRQKASTSQSEIQLIG